MNTNGNLTAGVDMELRKQCKFDAYLRGELNPMHPFIVVEIGSLRSSTILYHVKEIFWTDMHRKTMDGFRTPKAV